ncbi:MAG TPA: hypothetical protein VK474_00095 [Chthoniobacterales bacterium]|nr:hypothetical protein [Chthoniobacterales bacterium]
MSAAAKTIVLFGIYMAVTGLTLVVAPNTLLGILQLPLTQEPWIRLLGMFMIIVAFYYYRTAQSEAAAFFRATVYGRTVMGFFMVWLGLTTIGWVLAVFAVGEWIGAGATWLALRSSAGGGT